MESSNHLLRGAARAFAFDMDQGEDHVVPAIRASWARGLLEVDGSAVAAAKPVEWLLEW